MEELTGRLRRLGHDRPHDQGPGELESGNLQMEVSFFCPCVFNVSRLDEKLVIVHGSFPNKASWTWRCMTCWPSDLPVLLRTGLRQVIAMVSPGCW